MLRVRASGSIDRLCSGRACACVTWECMIMDASSPQQRGHELVQSLKMTGRRRASR